MKNLFKAVALAAIFSATTAVAQPSGLGLRRDVGPRDTVFIINFDSTIASNTVVSQSSSTLRMSVESPTATNSAVNQAYQNANMFSEGANRAATRGGNAPAAGVLENQSLFRFYLHDRDDWDGARRDRQRIELAGARNSRIMAYDTTRSADWPIDTRTIFTYRWKIKIPDNEGTGWPAHFNGTSHMGFNHLFQIKAVVVAPASVGGNEAAGPMMTWSVVNGNRFRFIYTRLSCGGGSRVGIDVPMSSIRNRWLYKEVTIHYSDSGYVHSVLWDIDDPSNPVRLGETFFAADTWRRPEGSPCREREDLPSTTGQQIRPKWGLYRSFNGRQGEARMYFADATMIKRDFNTYIFPNGYNPRTGRIETGNPDPNIPVTGVTLNKPTMRIMAGSRETLDAAVTPTNATNRTVTWTTSAASVATVSTAGVVTAVAPGTATITATAGTGTGTRTATTSVTVVARANLDAAINYATSATAINTAARVSGGTTAPVASSDRGVNYIQQDPSAVGNWFSIDAEIPRRGNYRIELIYKGGPERATIQPYIGLNPGGGTTTDVAAVPANAIGSPFSMITPAPTVAANVSTLIGSAATLSGTIRGDTLYYHRVITESRDLMRGTNTFKTVITVSGGRYPHLPVSLIITPVAGGPVYCDVCDQLEAQCTCGDIAVESVTVNKSAITIMREGRETLTAGVVPSNATVRTITWSSNNPAVATVSAAGLVTAVAPGNATITATAGTGAGARTATTTVTVVPAIAQNAIRAAYVSSTNIRNLTVRGEAADAAGGPISIDNSNDGGVFYVQQNPSLVGSWFSIDVDVPVRGLYKIDFIYKTGATRATVQPYIGLAYDGDDDVAAQETNRVGAPVNMRETPVNVSTVIGALDTRNSHYYLVTLAESRELRRGPNTFKTVVTENGGQWAHLPVQLVLTPISATTGLCPYCDELEEECICPICDGCGNKESECSCPSTIRRRQPTDNRRGILLENAIVSDLARIEVKTPNSSFVNIRILDNLGNTLFTTSGKSDDVFVWNLTNNVGRFVGNGTYLIIAETTDVVNGQMYVYYTRIGVRR